MTDMEEQVETKNQAVWIVFWTKAGQEKKAISVLERTRKELNLGDKVLRILVPMQTITRLRQGKRVLMEKPYYKGYIFVEMIPDPNVIDILTKTGVVKPVIAKDAILKLSEEEVNKIIETVKREEEKKEKEVPFLKGEKVKIVDGPFQDFTGVVDEVYMDRGKLKVIVSIFNRSTPVILSFEQVERF